MTAPSPLSFLIRPGLPDLAYRKIEGRPPTALFLGGFASDMEGTKAAFLANACAARGQGFVRFDYSGHGASGGDFEEGTIGVWSRDALAVIDTLTDGPLLLIGSSMGGWIALLSALARPERVIGLIGLAAAPDFTRDIPPRMSAAQRTLLAQEGRFALPHDYDGKTRHVTRELLDDGEDHCLLPGPIAIDCPVRLIQGVKDAEVPWQMAQRLSKALTSKDKEVYLREEGDHRLSTPDDLALLERLVIELSGISGA